VFMPPMLMEGVSATICAVKDGFADKYWVYIVASKTGTLYTGTTGDLFVRTMQHKAGEFEGFAKTHGCKRLVCFESFDNVHNAINREKQVKSWRRGKKIGLIEKDKSSLAGLG
jgi:putative endonuclease